MVLLATLFAFLVKPFDLQFWCEFRFTFVFKTCALQVGSEFRLTVSELLANLFENEAWTKMLKRWYPV